MLRRNEEFRTQSFQLNRDDFKKLLKIEAFIRTRSFYTTFQRTGKIFLKEYYRRNNIFKEKADFRRDTIL